MDCAEVPAAYPARHRAATALYAANMMLAYATFALLGGAILDGTLLPEWLGWTGIGAGLAGLVGFPLLRGGPFAPPIIAHAYGLLVGIILLM